MLALHLLQLLPFLCGGHRQLAIENPALRQPVAVYRRTAARSRLRTTDRPFWVGLTRVWAGVEAVPRDRDPGHRPVVAAAPVLQVLDPALWSLNRRSSARQRRDQGSRHPHGHHKPPLGRPAHPWRDPEARHRRGRAHRVPPDAENGVPSLLRPGGRSSPTMFGTWSRSTSSPCPPAACACSSSSSCSSTTAGASSTSTSPNIPPPPGQRSRSWTLSRTTPHPVPVISKHVGRVKPVLRSRVSHGPT
jgi:hypothetical protein